MYLSLKGSLGHTAITDRVGESLLQIAEGSSAAYSLRNLGSDSPSVVRVRRESDNAERDFSAQDINTSVVENWVNQQIIPPLDLRELTPTGRDGPLIPAAAAYSLRNLSNSYTGNVVKVRRNSDDAEADFTAVEVSDGTLLAWVNTDIDKLDLQAESGGLIGNVTNETATGFDFSVNNEGSSGFKHLLSPANVTTGIYTATFDVVLNSGSLSKVIIRNGNPPEEEVLVAGANSFTFTPSGIAGIYFRTDATAVADVSITNITLTQTTADGHVSTWYDQSGNTNHATQATPASQPKVVDAGVLVLSNGNAAIKATSNNVLNFSMASLSADGQQSTFSVFENDITSQSAFASAFKVLSTTGAGTSFLERRPLWLQSPTGILYFTSGMASVYGTADRERRIYSHLTTDAAGGTATVHQDGVLVDTRAVPLDANSTFSSGCILETSSSVVGAFYMSELIYYPSDQSANRAAIEENIDNHYGIISAGSYVNAAGDSYINAAGDTYLQP